MSRQYRRFPEWDGTPPDVPDGVEVRWVEEDFGPATKVLPAVRDFQGAGVDILFCDDDQVYRPILAERLLAARARRPNDVVAISGMQTYPAKSGARVSLRLPRRRFLWRTTNPRWQARRLWARALDRLGCAPYVQPPCRVTLRTGYADGFEGFMGVMVSPSFFPEEVFDIPDFAWPVDDVWLSGHVTRKGHGIWVIGGLFEPMLTPIRKPSHLDHTALNQNAIGGVGRNDANLETIRFFQATYDIWT
ncbi:glycosyltransferase family 2 protein [Shimia sp. SK013]|uniref:glycosyltransferase family 2 protein n=1 Tax=Shimia sp. SK013 TaxID=1389006 RepID=UPI00128FB8DE|nr:glycosyltransferase family 2 protein [Shimia sp. SK013]